MSLDTKDFDAKIADLQAQVDAAQSTLDQDPFTIALRDHQAKGSAVADLRNQLTSIQQAKEQAIALQDQIDTATASLGTLQASVNAQVLPTPPQPLNP